MSMKTLHTLSASVLLGASIVAPSAALAQLPGPPPGPPPMLAGPPPDGASVLHRGAGLWPNAICLQRPIFGP